MKDLEKRIAREGEILPGNVVKVGSFLNQRIDSDFMMEIGREIARLFADENITQVLTVEASGIAFALAVGAALHVPMVFAKKQLTNNVSGELLTAVAHSYTHGTDNTLVLPKQYLSPDSRVLIVDDFLATGEAVDAMLELVRQAGAVVAGVAIGVEKGFQGGGDRLRAMGLHVESLAIVESTEGGALRFR